jgi:hypothetical protein
MSLVPTQIVYGGPSGLQAQDAALAWDDTHKTMSIGAIGIVASILFNPGVPLARILVGTPTSDVPTADILVQAQAPFASASVNQTPGNINLNIPAPIGGAAHSGINLQDSGVTWLTFQRTASLSNISFAASGSPKLSQAVRVSGNGQQFLFQAQTASQANGIGGNLVMDGGDAPGMNGVGGQMILTGGFGAATGGNVQVTGGQGGVTGGSILFNSGVGPNAGSVLFGSGGTIWLSFKNTGGSTSMQLSSTAPHFTFNQVAATSGAGVPWVIAAQSTSAVAAGGNMSLQAGNSTGIGGTGGNLLLSAGNGSTPGSTQMQTGGNTWLTFANAGGSSGLLFAETAPLPVIRQLVATAAPGAQLTIASQSSSSVGLAGGPLLLTSGTGGGASGNGGNITILAGSGGSGSGASGSILLSTGSGVTDGSIQLQKFGTTWLTFATATGATFATTAPTPTVSQATTSTGNGAVFTIRAQSTTAANATGGVLFLTAGSNTAGTNGIGGDVIVAAGAGKNTSTGAGGNIVLAVGNGFTHGSVQVQDSGSTWLTFSAVGSATVTFSPTAVTPSIGQANTSSGSGALLSLYAQTTTAAGATGGNLLLSAGYNTVGTNGMGGDVVITSGAGNGAGSGAGGRVILNASGGATAGVILFQAAGTTWLTFSKTGSSTNVTFNSNAPAVTISQGTTTSASGVTMAITAQGTSFGGGVGGNLSASAGSSSAGVGGNLLLNPGHGTTNGDVQIFDGSSNLVFRVDGPNRTNKVSGPLIGDSTTNDSLRFGVTTPISLAGRSTDLTLTNVQYANQTMTFNGTPAAATFNLVLPNVAGFTKVFDLTSVTPGVATISAKAGTSSVLLSPGRATTVWYDGTTLHALTGAGLVETDSATDTGVSLVIGPYTTLVASGVSVTLAAGEKLIIDVASLLNTAGSGAGTLAAQYQVTVDASVVSHDAISTDNTRTGYNQPYARSIEVTGLSAGTHTVDFQARTDNTSTATYIANNNSLRVMRSAA